MPTRLYLLPTVEIAQGGITYRGPAYLPWRFGTGEAGLESLRWAIKDCGGESIVLAAVDGSSTQHTTLNGQANVIQIPTNLDATLTSGQVTAAQNRLETLHLPGNWISTSTTWRELVRFLYGMFSLLGRFHAKARARLLAGAVSLSTTYGELPVGVQTTLLNTAQSFGVSTDGLQDTTTLRVILRAFANAWLTTPVTIGGVEV
jgi:hypothetical protein